MVHSQEEVKAAVHAQSDSEGADRGVPFRILFVCTGNTCRSPLAQAIAQRELARLGWKGVEVRSSGVATSPGSPATEGARRIAARHGMDLSRHVSEQITTEMIAWADLILAMIPGHLLVLRRYGGEQKSILFTDFVAGGEGMSGAEIADPFGGGDEEYEATYEEISGLMGPFFDRLKPLLAP